MNTGAEKFAQTQPIAETNDADRVSKEAGLEMNDVDSDLAPRKLDMRMNS